MDAINDAGIKHGETCYARVGWLESRLKQLRNSQGEPSLLLSLFSLLQL